MDDKKGILYLIPTTLGDNEPLEVLPISVKQKMEILTHFIVENEKTARRFIKKMIPKKNQSEIKIFKLDKYADALEVQSYLDDCLLGKNMGLMSEAGVPAIADPGAEIVKLAHQKGIKVVPLVGPSSIILALMASGFNGQSFAFNGYLPIDSAERKKALKNLEKRSQSLNQSQIFIETPYRNEKMFNDLKSALNNNTQLCIACNITMPDEYIKSMSISKWKNENIDLRKKPTIFIIYKS
ncbi:MAG: SAM-dependent methyltransferase [Lutibacter sp.]